MSNITCIIIEDEPLAAKVLSDYIAEVPFLELKATFRDAVSATGYLRENSPNLIFLDIHLPRLKGIAFLKTLINPPAVIITTAYHQYAVEGFEMNVTDYLLKPFEFQRFLTAVTKVKTLRNQAATSPERAEIKDSVFVNIQKRKVRILFSEIVYIESQKEYIRINTTKASYLSKMGTQDIEALLPPDMFKRIHRSFIVAINKIDSYTAEAVELNGVSVPVGRAYKDIIDSL
jgi:two-component system, LytTR family, response regulator